MYCMNCGHPNPDDAAFCQKCGASCATTQAEVKQNTKSGADAGKKRSKGVVIGLCAGIGVLAVVLVALVAVMLTGDKSTDEDTTRKGHNTIETTASAQENNVNEPDDNYETPTQGSKDEVTTKASTPQTSSGYSVSGNGALYMGSASYGDSMLYMVENPPARYHQLCFAGNYAFYIDTDDTYLYRCNSDGTGHMKFHTINEYPGQLRSFNDEIYYVGYANGFSSGMHEDAAGHKPYGFHWVNKNGGSSRLVEAEIPDKYTFYDGNVVFADGNTIYSSSLSSTENFGSNSVFLKTKGVEVIEIKLVTQYDVLLIIDPGNTKLAAYNMYTDDYVILYDDYAEKVMMYGNKYYFLAQGTLYSVNTDGTGLTVVVDGVDDVIMYGGNIFYTDISKRDLYRINADGSGKKMLVQYMYCTDLVYHNNKVYFVSYRDDDIVCWVDADGKSMGKFFASNAGAKDVSDYLEDGIEYFC